MFHLMKGNVSDNIGNKITHYIIGIIAKDSDDPCKIMLPHADLEPKSSKNLVKLCGFFLVNILYEYVQLRHASA